MPKRSSCSSSRYDRYDDAKKYDDPYMGFTSEYDDPYQHSDRSTSRYDDPYSSHKYDTSASRDEPVYAPRSYEKSYSSTRDESVRGHSLYGDTLSSSRYGDSSPYDASSRYRDPYSSTSGSYSPTTRTNDDWESKYAGKYLSTKYDEQPLSSSRYDSDPYSSSTRHSTRDSSSRGDYQSGFARDVLGIDRGAPPPRASFDTFHPDDRDLYSSASTKYSYGPTSDPYSNEKYSSSRGLRRSRRDSRYY